MRRSLQNVAVIFGLFCLQLFILLKGIAIADKLEKPFILLAVSLFIAYAYIVQVLRAEGGPAIAKPTLIRTAIGWGLGLLSISVLYGPFRKGFDEFANYREMSDVIMQIEVLYERWSNGIFPYYPLEHYAWHPYPVYMTLNWLPAGLAKVLSCDVRWIGVLFLAGAASIWGGIVWGMKRGILIAVFATILPAIAMFAFLHWERMGISISYEVIIAAYYLVLAAGLASRNLPLTVTGIVACLLSRYTMVFWLPLVLILLWTNTSRKTNLITWAVIIVSVLALYLVPFYFRDPSILTSGLAYHNHCYVDAWNGLGDPEHSTAFDEGLNFSWFIREWTSGTMEHRVMIGRMIQGGIQILVLVCGVLLYKKYKSKVNFYDHALLVLFVQLFTFFITSPQTYMYYYLPFTMVSAVVCAKVMLVQPIKRLEGGK